MRTSYLLIIGSIVTGLALAGCTTKNTPPTSTTSISSSSSVVTKVTPADGWMLHIDARKHFTNDFDKDPIAHHYCKPVSGGLTECQLYDGDGPDARLVGVETIISKDMYRKLPADEKKMWHYHKDEIAKVDAKLPDLSPEEAAKVVQSIQETYGKIFIFWNPGQNDLPVGQPHVTVID